MTIPRGKNLEPKKNHFLTLNIYNLFNSYMSDLMIGVYCCYNHSVLTWSAVQIESFSIFLELIFRESYSSVGRVGEC